MVMRKPIALMGLILMALLMGAKPVDEKSKVDAQAAVSDANASGNAHQNKIVKIDRDSLLKSNEERTKTQKEAAQATVDDFNRNQAGKVAVYEKDSQKMADETVKKSLQTFDQIWKSDKSLMDIEAFLDKTEGKPEQQVAKYRVYISRSMPVGQMKQILAIAQGQPDMVVAIRGLMPNEKIDGLVRWVVSTGNLDKNSPPPNVMLDPVAFRKNNVSYVPVIEKLDVDGNPVAWVRGSASVRFLEDEIGRGKKGDLGKIGPVSKVIERDIIEVSKENMNVEKIKAEAQNKFKTYWQRQELFELPKANANRMRLVDPSVTLEEGITAPDGTVIAYPGERVNPMDAMPFDLVLVVIDARDTKQVGWAADLAKRLGGRQVMIVTTNMPKSENWDFYVKTVVRLNEPLYVINAEMIERFKIEKVPSMVVGKARNLAVYEYKIQ